MLFIRVNKRLSFFFSFCRKFEKDFFKQTNVERHTFFRSVINKILKLSLDIRELVFDTLQNLVFILLNKIFFSFLLSLVFFL